MFFGQHSCPLRILIIYIVAETCGLHREEKKMKKRVDTYSHYNKDPKKLDKKIKEIRSGDLRSP